MNIKKDISNNCRDLIKRLLTQNAKERISIEDVYSHQWMKDWNSDNLENDETLSSNLKDDIEFLKADNGLDKSNIKYKEYLEGTTKHFFILWILCYILFSSLSVLLFIQIVYFYWTFFERDVYCNF